MQFEGERGRVKATTQTLKLPKAPHQQRAGALNDNRRNDLRARNIRVLRRGRFTDPFPYDPLHDPLDVSYDY